MFKNKQKNKKTKYIVMVLMIIVGATAEIAVIKITIEEISPLNLA